MNINIATMTCDEAHKGLQGYAYDRFVKDKEFEDSPILLGKCAKEFSKGLRKNCPYHEPNAKCRILKLTQDEIEKAMRRAISAEVSK